MLCMGTGVFLVFVFVLLVGLLFIGTVMPILRKETDVSAEQVEFESEVTTWHTDGHLVVGDDFVEYVKDTLHIDVENVDSRKQCVVRKVRHEQADAESDDIVDMDVYRMYILEFEVDGNMVRWPYETKNHDLCAFLKTVRPVFDIAYHMKDGKVSDILVCSVDYP